MKITVRQEAVDDLQSIWEYIAFNGYPSRADRVGQNLVKRIYQLHEFPNIGKSYETARTGLRGDSQPPFIIFYRIEPERIVVVRVLHSARDLMNTL